MATEGLLERAPSRSRRRTWWGAALGALLVLAGTGAWYWTFRPHELTDYTPIPRGMHALINLGETGYATQLIGPDNNFLHDTTVDLRAVTPVIVENSSRAVVRVLLCTPNDSAGEGLSGFLSDFCQSARPFRPGRINLGEGHDQRILILAVTPRQQGNVDIRGLTVRYRDGLRTGTQHTGNEISMVTT